MTQKITTNQLVTPTPLPDPETALRVVSRAYGRAWRCVLEIEAQEARAADEADARRAAMADERGAQDDDKTREG